jgi:hypothetical protein
MTKVHTDRNKQTSRQTTKCLQLGTLSVSSSTLFSRCQSCLCILTIQFSFTIAQNIPKQYVWSNFKFTCPLPSRLNQGKQVYRCPVLNSDLKFKHTPWGTSGVQVYSGSALFSQRKAIQTTPRPPCIKHHDQMMPHRLSRLNQSQQHTQVNISYSGSPRHFTFRILL